MIFEYQFDFIAFVVSEIAFFHSVRPNKQFFANNSKTNDISVYVGSQVEYKFGHSASFKHTLSPLTLTISEIGFCPYMEMGVAILGVSLVVKIMYPH